MLEDSFPDTLSESSLKAFELPRLLEEVSRYAVSGPAKREIHGLRPLQSKEDILHRQALVEGLRYIIQQGSSLPVEAFEDLEDIFRKVVPDEAVLMADELLKVLPFFSSVVRIKSLGRTIPQGPLKEFISHLHGHPDILSEIHHSVNPDGSISDDASPVLKGIRQRMRSIRERIKSVLEGFFQDRQKLYHIQDTYITERNGRYVIPVKSDHKGHIKGIIHDVSNTEATVFVEPAEIVSLGNELEDLRAEEKIEEWRILKAISKTIRDNLDEVLRDYKNLVYLDCLWAIARFSEKMKMTVPEIIETPGLVIKEGRNPLLHILLERAGEAERLVPLDFELGQRFKGLVITGSNAGGKTVALKTIGLLTAMALTGMPVPAKEASRFYLFKKIMVDIGDEQSLDAHLSTFSGHLLRMKAMLKESDSESLILIDELGTGTDPEEGGALGAAFLEGFLKKQSLVVVTTHLSFLKAFAQNHPEMENGAMLSETVTVNGETHIRPTYRLSIGQTGQSHAFSIAEMLGVPEEILTTARSYLKQKGSIIEEALAEVSGLKRALETELRKAERGRVEVIEMRDRLRAEIEQIRARREKYLKEAEKKALQIIEKAKKKAEKALEGIERASKSEARRALKALSEEARRLRETISERIQPLGPESLREGLPVRITPEGPEGEIIRIEGQRVLVRAGGIQIETRPDSLYPARGTKRDRPQEQVVTDPQGPGPEKIDLRGQRGEDAIAEVDRGLNRAVLEGIQEIRIIHGKGKGILKRQIREFLKTHPLVGSFRSGYPEEGGEGITVVNLK